MKDNNLNQAADAPSSELAERFIRADRALIRMHDRLSALEDRLQPILTPKETKGAEVDSPTLLLSSFGHAILSFENSADRASLRIEELLRKLAL